MLSLLSHTCSRGTPKCYGTAVLLLLASFPRLGLAANDDDQKADYDRKSPCVKMIEKPLLKISFAEIISDVTRLEGQLPPGIGRIIVSFLPKFCNTLFKSRDDMARLNEYFSKRKNNRFPLDLEIRNHKSGPMHELKVKFKNKTWNSASKSHLAPVKYFILCKPSQPYFGGNNTFHIWDRLDSEFIIKHVGKAENTHDGKRIWLPLTVETPKGTKLNDRLIELYYHDAHLRSQDDDGLIYADGLIYINMEPEHKYTIAFANYLLHKLDALQPTGTPAERQKSKNQSKRNIMEALELVWKKVCPEETKDK